MATAQLTFEDNALAQSLYGEQGKHLKIVNRSLGVKTQARGNQVTVDGPEAMVRLAQRVLLELYELLRLGYPVLAQDVQYTIRILQDKESASVKDIFLDTVYISAMKRRISPKSLNQKRYIEAMRTHDIVFGIGPAGTGKTYLAMAMAVAALMNQESSASSSPGRRWRPAKSWASCPATWRRRSTPICGPCTTPCTT